MGRTVTLGSRRSRVSIEGLRFGVRSRVRFGVRSSRRRVGGSARFFGSSRVKRGVRLVRGGLRDEGPDGLRSVEGGRLGGTTLRGGGDRLVGGGWVFRLREPDDLGGDALGRPLLLAAPRFVAERDFLSTCHAPDV